MDPEGMGEAWRRVEVMKGDRILIVMVVILAVVAAVGFTYLWFDECLRLRPWWYCMTMGGR
jgi:hypothetical protein